MKVLGQTWQITVTFIHRQSLLGWPNVSEILWVAYIHPVLCPCQVLFNSEEGLLIYKINKKVKIEKKFKILKLTKIVCKSTMSLQN